MRRYKFILCPISSTTCWISRVRPMLEQNLRLRIQTFITNSCVTSMLISQTYFWAIFFSPNLEGNDTRLFNLSLTVSTYIY